MKVLVTGGTGFTGSALARRLLEEGHEVRVIDNSTGLFYDELSKDGARIDLGTIEDKAFCEKAIDGAEMVFHLAAAFRQLNVPKKYYWDVNVEGTRHLAEAAAKAGVSKFIYCSTQGVHGHIANPPGDENSPIAPEDYYQYTKYQGEIVANEVAEKSGMHVVTLRPTAIYGPGDPARYLMLYRRCRNGVFHMFGDGLTTYHPVYIDNLVDGFLAAASSTNGTGEPYIIADEQYFTLNDLVTYVGQSMGVNVKVRHWPFAPLYGAAVACELACKPLRISPPIFRRRVDWFRQVRAFSIEKAKRELGYQPRVDIHEGLERTAKWYRDNGYI